MFKTITKTLIKKTIDFIMKQIHEDRQEYICFLFYRIKEIILYFVNDNNKEIVTKYLELFLDNSCYYLVDGKSLFGKFDIRNSKCKNCPIRNICISSIENKGFDNKFDYKNYKWVKNNV